MLVVKLITVNTFLISSKMNICATSSNGINSAFIVDKKENLIGYKSTIIILRSV